MEKILERFDVEVRENPLDTPGRKVVRDNHVTRIEGPCNFVYSWKFTNSNARQVISEHAKYFREIGEELIWRVYDYDKPSNIEACLAQEGFVPSSPGTLMFLSLEEELYANSENDIRPITSHSSLRDYLSVAATVFGGVDAGDFQYFSDLLSDPNFALFSGYVDDEPVASGRLEIPMNASFGLLFGGGVLPQYRGRGLYRALIKAREVMARDLGLKYLSTEAQESSRPILQKLGFIPLAKETTWVLPADPLRV